MGEIVTPDGKPATPAPLTANDRLMPLYDWLRSEPHPSAFQRVIVNAILGIVQMVGTLTRQYVDHRHTESGEVMLPANVLEEAARITQEEEAVEKAAAAAPDVTVQP